MAARANKVIWITGASSGLGRSLALALAAKGNHVIASARNRQQLDRLTELDANIIPIECDITDEVSLEAAIRRIAKGSLHLDQVILNAGNCEYLDFPEPDWSAARRVMEINYFGTLNCVKAALPLLRQASDRAHIVAIASQVTAAPFPRAEAYGASKAAMQYFFDSLRIDLATEGIDVSVVNPGFVDTPLTRKNDFDMPFLMDADQAARRIVRNLESRPRSYSFPLRLSVLLALSKLMPGLWQKMLAPKNDYRSTESNRGTGE
ncbi:MAG: SDR family NAD(P)-dependent oxidoreductase [Gammaproteobacteria bacterium]|nr:MAG: SDR family NAD(P)-dependent oxidoreductase [Gammaproteobacteria bacterium]UCH39773.1 MAG: SDR family NAD(P)-dependent oxidoreductase [Gammaproteobacteria bacterium]